MKPTSTWHEALSQIIASYQDTILETRRHFHQHPELSGYEFETSFYIYQRLRDAGLAVQLGTEGRGVIADLITPDASTPQPDRPARLLALRADLDALRIGDVKDVPYRSQKEGVMHACGHDAHAAILMGAMLATKTLVDRGAIPFPVQCRAIFQPAEETVRGAREMISVGAMQHVDAIVALHVDPSRDVGAVGVRKGVLTSSCDEVRIVIHGRGGHAARPHEARDPVAAAAQLIQTLYTYVPRATDSQDAVVLTVCQVIAGDNPNVIPEEVALRGTLRTLDPAIRSETIQHIERIAGGVADATGTRIEVGYGVATPSVVNDPQIIDLLGQLMDRQFGERCLPQWVTRPSMGSEDFALYLKDAPGALLRLGCRGESVGGRPLHSVDFDIDERCLAIGSELLAMTALGWAEQQAGKRGPNRTPSAD